MSEEQQEPEGPPPVKGKKMVATDGKRKVLPKPARAKGKEGGDDHS